MKVSAPLPDARRWSRCNEPGRRRSTGRLRPAIGGLRLSAFGPALRVLLARPKDVDGLHGCCTDGASQWPDRCASAWKEFLWCDLGGHNREGTVEAVFAGPAAAVDGMIEACRRGPKSRMSRRLMFATPVASDLALRQGDDGFEVLPTV